MRQCIQCMWLCGRCSSRSRSSRERATKCIMGTKSIWIGRIRNFQTHYYIVMHSIQQGILYIYTYIHTFKIHTHINTLITNWLLAQDFELLMVATDFIFAMIYSHLLLLLSPPIPWKKYQQIFGSTKKCLNRMPIQWLDVRVWDNLF